MEEGIQIAIALFLAGVVGWLVLLLRKYIVQKIGIEKYEAIESLVEGVVRFVEQMGVNLGWSGSDKKVFAVNTIYSLLKKMGYEVDKEVIDMLIERAVQVINEGSLKLDIPVDSET